MWQYYIMVVLATVLYSIQFVFTKCYQKEKGASFFYSTIFSSIACFVSVPFFLILSKGKVEFTWFSFFIASLFALDCILCTVFGAKTLSKANLSVYSLFLMLGGMLLPFIYGFTIGEKLTVFKGIAVLCVLGAMLCTLQKEEGKKLDFGTVICFILIFITNGLSGVLTYIHQRSTVEIVSSSGFLFLCNATQFILSALLVFGIYLYGKAKNPKLLEMKKSGEEQEKSNKKSWLIAVGSIVGYMIVHSIAMLCTTISAKYVDAGVQSTIVTGGCMVMSALFGLLFGEKITKKTAVSLLLAVMGTLCIIF